MKSVALRDWKMGCVLRSGGKWKDERVKTAVGNVHGRRCMQGDGDDADEGMIL